MATKINYFLPYLRQGMTTLASHHQVPGKRMTIPVKLTIASSNKTDQLEKVVTLFGPGDLMGINENVVSRLSPAPNLNNFDANLVPFIEFNQPDFLWRFSSLQTTDGKNWMPWLTLIVLKSDNGEEAAEFELVGKPDAARTMPPQIQVKTNAVLPDLRESWRWAHVHTADIMGLSQAQILESIKSGRNKVVCRLLSPRKLKPNTRYHAFLIPAFKIGTEAAMGISDGTDDRMLFTWETPEEGIGKRLPYYYDWTFQTGSEGDFEQLVRKLKPTDLKAMGTRLIDCSNPGYGMEEETLELRMEAALKSLDTKFQDWGMDSSDNVTSNEKQKALADLLNSRMEEITNENGDIEVRLRVTPPVYGQWYASREGDSIKVDQKNRHHWLEELNLDFRHRAAAGLGVQFVRDNQENLMKAAWEQLSRIRKVNQELNLGRFGREVSSHLFRRLDKMKPNNLFQIALPVQSKIAFQPKTTVGALLNKSAITNNMTRTKAKKFFFKFGNAEAKTDFRPVAISNLVSTSYKVNGLKKAVHKISASAVNPAIADGEAVSWPSGVVDHTINALNPKNSIESRLVNRMSRFRNIEKNEADPDPSEDQLHPIKWHPEFHRPMYHFLRSLSQEYILPGLEHVPQNSVGLLQTNRRFVEAYMMGLNHEMASELRWREFPTDLSGSYFRSFWDSSIYSVDDNEKEQFRNTDIGKNLLESIKTKYGADFDTFPAIEATYTLANPNETEKEIADAYEAAIEKWLLTREEDKDIDRLTNWKLDNRLGDHPVEGKPNNEQEDQNQMVLLVRGELLQKFSNTLIYLVKKKADGKPDLGQQSVRTHPVFEGALPPDIVFIGFPIKKAEVPDYYVIFEERMSELRFGLDQTPEGSEPGPEENDFSWEHFPSLSPEGYLDGIQPVIFTQEWNSAAFISKAMMQKQIRTAVELNKLIPE